MVRSGLLSRWLRITGSIANVCVPFESSKPRAARLFQAPACVSNPSQGLRDILLLAPVAVSGGATCSRDTNYSKYYHIRKRKAKKHRIHPFGVQSNGRPKGPLYGLLLEQKEEFAKTLLCKPSDVATSSFSVKRVRIKNPSKRTRSSLKTRVIRSLKYFSDKTAATKARKQEQYQKRAEQRAIIRARAKRAILPMYRDRKPGYVACSFCNEYITIGDVELCAFDTTYHHGYGYCYSHKHCVRENETRDHRVVDSDGYDTDDYVDSTRYYPEQVIEDSVLHEPQILTMGAQPAISSGAKQSKSAGERKKQWRLNRARRGSGV